jgi:hypothetical protein
MHLTEKLTPIDGPDAADPNSPIRTLRTFAIRDGEGRLEG